MNRTVTVPLDTFSGNRAYAFGGGDSNAQNALARFLARWILTLLIGFLTISTFEGALRFYAARAGLPWLIYIKDVVLIGAMLLGILNTCLTNIKNLPFLVVLALLTIGTVAGLLILPDSRQPLFAAKTWFPLLCGTVVATSIEQHWITLTRTCGILWLCAVAGIVLTWLWRAPWIGFIYDVGGVALEGSREWTIGDVDRAPGFSRASFDAALQVLFFGTIMITAARFYIVGFCLWLVSAAAIYLTLSRSALVALGVAIVIHFLAVGLKITQRLAKVGVIVLAIAVVGLPFAAARYYKNTASVSETENVTSTSSFEERAVQTWPDGFALLKRGGNLVTGRGLGGIGVAQQFFEPSIFNPGDNFFVYIWGAFGALGAAFVGFLAWQTWRTPVPFNLRRRAGIVLVAAFLAVGLTLNGIEAAIASLFLGVGLVWMSASSERA